MRFIRPANATRLQVSAALIAAALTSSAANAQLARDGDVTINVTSTQNVLCDECPDGMGTRICYEVYRVPEHLSESDDDAKDFHIQTRDGNPANYHCFATHDWNGEDWLVADWTGRLASQVEGTQTKHYVSWTMNDEAWRFRPGDTFRFCVVYCGPTGNLDNTLEFYLTTDGAPAPHVPDREGNRGNVPDVERQDKKGNRIIVDDPGWYGQRKQPLGTISGFANYTLDSNPLIGGETTTFWVEGATPDQTQYLTYSLRGIGLLYVPQLQVELDLQSPKLAATTKPDGLGIAVYDLPVPRAATGRDVWLQNCEFGQISNVIERTIE